MTTHPAVAERPLATLRPLVGYSKLPPLLQKLGPTHDNSRSGLTMPLCVASPCSFARRVVMQYPNQLGVVTSGRGRQCDGASSLGQ